MKISHNEIHVLTDNIVRLPHWQKKKVQTNCLNQKKLQKNTEESTG